MTRILKVEPMDHAPFFVPQHKLGSGEGCSCETVEQWAEYMGFDPKGNVGPMGFPTLEDAQGFLVNPSIYQVGEFPTVKISIV